MPRLPRTRSLKRVAVLTLIALACTPAYAAVTTTFRVWGSPWLYAVPQSEYNQAFEGALSDGTLIVHILTNATGGMAIDPTSGKIVVQGDKITLCYKRKAPNYASDAPVPAIVYSQALEYSIAGLPKKKYSYEVSQKCE